MLYSRTVQNRLTYFVLPYQSCTKMYVCFRASTHRKTKRFLVIFVIARDSISATVKCMFTQIRYHCSNISNSFGGKNFQIFSKTNRLLSLRMLPFISCCLHVFHRLFVFLVKVTSPLVMRGCSVFESNSRKHFFGRGGENFQFNETSTWEP